MIKKLNYSIVFVSEMKRSIGFYRDILGLGVKFESPHWTEMATEGATVALHHTTDQGPAPIPGSPGSCQLGFEVPDVKAFHEKVLAKGAKCLRPPKQEDFGILALYADPDGLAISIFSHN